MSRTIEILGQEPLLKRLEELQSALKGARERLEPPEKLRALWDEGATHYYRNGHSERATFLGASLKFAQTLHALGRPRQEIQTALREGAEAFAPVLGILDFSTSEQSFSVAKKLARKFEGKELNTVSGRLFWPPNPRLGAGFKIIQVKVRKQPMQHEMAKALTAALMAWDFARAKALAEGYGLQPAEKGEDANHFGLMRETILGNRAGALAFLQNIPKGYDPDFPPRLLQLAEGVIREDAALVRAGLKTISKRFKTAWTLKTYATPARLRRGGTLERMMPDIRSHLIGHGWLLSDWAVAWLSLAWSHGMRDAFSEPGLFTEWTPWELCCPEGSDSL